MKLSVIYQYGNIEMAKKIIKQLTDDAELVIYAKKITNELKAVAAGNVRIVRKKNVVSEAKGDFVSFILAYDYVYDCYVKSLLDAITDDVDYIPIKWKYAHWHEFAFTGDYPIPYLFANAYKRNLNIGVNGFKINRKQLSKCVRGKPIDKIIYDHMGN